MMAAGLVHDPAVPGLELLLSDDPLRHWLAERGEVLLRRNYLRYKPGTSCVAGVRLASGPAFLLAVSAAAAPKLDKSIVKAPGDVLAHDRERLLLLASFTGDRDLPALADLEYLVGRLLPDAERPVLETLVHKPQRRWVGLARTGGDRPPVVVRAYQRGRVTHPLVRLRLAQQFRGLVRVPRLVARSTRSALMVAEFLPGPPLAGQQAGELLAAATAAGEVLARVHNHAVGAIPPALVADPGETATLVAALAPSLAGRVAELTRLLRVATPAAARTGMCHGDFSLDQVVGGEQGLGLIDWDRAGRGHQAADLGSAIAAGLPEDAAAALLEGYRRVRTVPPDLAWHLARARFQRLAEPFRLASPRWPEELQHRVAELESTMP